MKHVIFLQVSHMGTLKREEELQSEINSATMYVMLLQYNVYNVTIQYNVYNVRLYRIYCQCKVQVSHL